MEYLDYAIGGGADGYLLKDDMDSEIFSAIRMVRQGDSYVSPGFSRAKDAAVKAELTEF